MKTFFHLTPKESKGLEKQIFINAQCLYSDGLVVVEHNNSFSSGTSLLVLSLEETIKAIIVLLHSQGYKIYKIKDVNKVFTDHKFRHQLTQFIIGIMGLFSIVYNQEQKEIRPVVKTKFKIGGVLLGVLKAIPNVLNSYFDISNIEKFNDYKNNGFYVGFRNQLLEPSQEITQNEFEKVKKVNQKMATLYTELVNLFHEQPKTNEQISINSELKKDLKLLIDNALTDVNLKKIHADITS